MGDGVFQVVFLDVLRPELERWCAQRGLRMFHIPVEDDIPTFGVGPIDQLQGKEKT